MRRFQTLSAKGSSALPSAGNWLMGVHRGGGTIFFFFFFVSVGGFSSVAENMRHFRTGALLSSSVVAWRRSAVARSRAFLDPSSCWWRYSARPQLQKASAAARAGRRRRCVLVVDDARPELEDRARARVQRALLEQRPRSTIFAASRLWRSEWRSW